MPADAERAWLVVLRHDPGALPPATLARLVDRLQRHGAGRADLAFTSADGSTIGLVLRSAAAARQLRAAAAEHVGTHDRGFVLVVELGEQMDAVGNSAGWRHIQRVMARGA